MINNINEEIEQRIRKIKEITYHEVDGKKIALYDGLPIENTKLINESEFVDRWLFNFAMGWVNIKGQDRLYFPINQWNRFAANLNEKGIPLSKEGRAAILVITDDQKEILFKIDPLNNPNFTPEEQQRLQDISGFLSQASSASKENQSEYLNMGSKFVKETLVKTTYSITDVIPNWFYKKHDLYPVAVKQSIFLKDNYGIDPKSDEFINASLSFVKLQKGIELTKEEKENILHLTNNEFNFENNVTPLKDVKDETVINNNQEDNVIDDPFEC